MKEFSMQFVSSEGKKNFYRLIIDGKTVSEKATMEDLGRFLIQEEGAVNDRSEDSYRAIN